MRVALYARCSTDDKGQEPETQLLPLRAYAAQQGWEVVGEYVDLASATDQRGRAKWRELLARVRRGGLDAIAVTKLDRAFRSCLDTYETLDYLARHRVGFIATTQPIDTTTPTGKLLLGVLAAVAEFERSLISERVRDGMARAKAEGKHVGRPKGSTDKRRRKRSGYYARGARQQGKEE